MGRTGFALIALLTLAVAGPSQLEAQGRGRGAQGRGAVQNDANRNRDTDVWDILTGDRRDVRDSRSAGPPFCQNGQGHPVHGREWCRQKGFGIGYGGSLGDIIFQNPRRSGRLNQGGIIEQIGDIVFGRVRDRSYALGARDPLYGTWGAGPNGGQMLTIRSGNLLIAELIDQTLDGRVDIFRMR